MTEQKWTERRVTEGKSDVSTWERVTSPKASETAEKESERRRIGVFLGAALGLAYGLVAQLINPLTLPGIPLYQPPSGTAGNVLLSALGGAALGFITCYPASAALGILFGGAASLAGILAAMLIRLGGLGFGVALVSSVFFSVPLAWLTVPVLALLRWVTEREVAARRAGEARLRRAWLPLLLALVLGALGAFELLPAEGRDNLVNTDALIRQGLQATSRAALPKPLQGPYVTSFPPSQTAGYTLEWTKNDLDRFMELRPSSTFDQHAAVIARFGGGYYLVCLYPTPKQAPNCANYDKLPAKAPERRDD